MLRPFRQVDVFTATPYAGNPVAVVLDGDGLSTEEMQRFAHWTNLSETTFVLPPTPADADYRVRIFTPVAELPFAGHPTLGTCHAWLSTGASPRRADVIVQECTAGLIGIRRTADGLAFAAPPLLRSGAVEESLLERIADVLHIERSAIVDAEWADNGPGWVAVLLGSADAVLALRPGYVDFDLGVVGPYPRARPRRSRCARSFRRTAPRSKIRSPPASTPHLRNGCFARVARRRRTSRVREPCSDAQAPPSRLVRRRRDDLGRRRRGHLRDRGRRTLSRTGTDAGKTMIPRLSPLCLIWGLSALCLIWGLSAPNRASRGSR